MRHISIREQLWRVAGLRLGLTPMADAPMPDADDESAGNHTSWHLTSPGLTSPHAAASLPAKPLHRLITVHVHDADADAQPLLLNIRSPPLSANRLPATPNRQ